MSAGEMDRCECQEGHTGPLMMLVAARCSAECGMELKGGRLCCEGFHWMPFASLAGCFRLKLRCWGCGAPALLALEPLASFAGAGT